jgi:hypothetical protein
MWAVVFKDRILSIGTQNKLENDQATDQPGETRFKQIDN